MQPIVMTMDMEFAHIDGYYGVKVYNVIYDVNDPEKTPIAYWTPLHGRWIKDDRSGKIYPCDEEYSNPLTREKIDNQSEEEYKKSSESFKKDGIPESITTNSAARSRSTSGRPLC